MRLMLAMFAVTGLQFCQAALPTSAAEPMASVSGTINVDGKPIPAGRIFLFVDADQFIGAKISKNGTFRLKQVPPGVYKVSIEGDQIHKRYHAEDQTGLAVDLDGGPNTCQFDLRS